MRVKSNLVLLLFLMSIMGTVYYSCQNVASGESYNGMVKGWVYDGTNKAPVEGVKVYAGEIPDTMYTDATGMFYYPKISMPRIDYTYNFVCKKSGYYDTTCSWQIRAEVLYSEDSIKLRRTAK
jgi:hypothetical protein